MTDCKGNELNIGDEVVYIYGKNSYAGLETGKSQNFIKIVLAKMNVVQMETLIF